MSIGVLGFVVWSWVLASPHSDMSAYIIYFAVCWNGLVLIGTLNGKNSISYTKSAGNLSLYSLDSKTQSAWEAIRETSFNFSPFRMYYITLFGNDAQHLSNNWLTWFIGFVEGLKKKLFFFKLRKLEMVPFQTGLTWFMVILGVLNLLCGLNLELFYLNPYFNLFLIMPLISYNNTDVEKTRILKENRSKSGIYCWVNKANGYRYIGSSNNLYRRLLQYFNTEYLLNHDNMVICRALLKHGYSNFDLDILEYCDSKDLLKREQYYIDLMNPEYNILKKAGSLLGFKHREETIAKMSISKAGEKNHMFGKLGEKHPMFYLFFLNFY